MITPREMLRDYMTVLNILMQNESASFSDIIGNVTLSTAAPESDAPAAPTAATVTMDDLEF
jgi:hypothetical protein